MPVAEANWRRLDTLGEDCCRLIAEPSGWMLCGHARFFEVRIGFVLSYVVRCNADWWATGADITGVAGGAEVAWKLVKIPEGWRLNDGAPMLSDCTDIDLAFTPATNLQPIRLGPTSRAEVAAVWFLPEGGGQIERLEQSYTPLGAHRYACASPEFEAELTVDPCGFATRYSGVWEGEVNAQ